MNEEQNDENAITVKDLDIELRDLIAAEQEEEEEKKARLLLDERPLNRFSD